jgi:hypothetical protein
MDTLRSAEMLEHELDPLPRGVVPHLFGYRGRLFRVFSDYRCSLPRQWD